MIGEAKVDNRVEQPYVAIRTQVTMQEMGKGVIPQLIGEVIEWLGKQGVAPAGAPFMRYRVIDMAAKLDVEVGWPVGSAPAGDGRVSANVLPAGRYASLVYTGVQNGVQANATLLDWGAKNGLAFDRWAVGNGEGFGARLESFLTGPADDPDPSNWNTEVAIRLAS